MKNENNYDIVRDFYIRRFKPFADELRKLNISINSLLDVGSKFSQDSEIIQNIFNIPNENIYCLELGEIFPISKKRYPNYNYFNIGLFSETLTKYVERDNITYNFIIGKDFIEKYFSSGFQFLKLDGGGNNWRILQGFEKYLSSIRIIYLESILKGSQWELKDIENQYYEETKNNLSNFKEIFNCSLPKNQIGSIFINKDFI